jgi:WD40 repeat protein
VGGFIDDETAVVGTAGYVFTLDLPSGAVLWRTEGESPTLPALSWDGRLVCVYGPRPGRASGMTHTLQLYAIGGACIEIATLRRPPEFILFNRQNDTVLVADLTGHVLAYSLEGALLSDTIARPPLASWCCMLDDSIVATDMSGEMRRSTKPGMRWQPLALSGFNTDVRTSSLAPLPAGRVLAGSEDGSVALLDLTVGIVGRVWGSGVNFAAGAVLADGSAAAIRGERRQGESIVGNELYIVPAVGPVERVTRSPHSQLITGITAVGTHVMTSDRGGRLVIWRSAAPILLVNAQGTELMCCGASFEGDVGIAGTSEDEVLVVPPDGGVSRVRLPARHEAPGVSAVAAAGTPRQIIAALQNSEVVSVGPHVWRVKAGGGMGTAVALDASRMLVATGHAFGRVHVWNGVSGEEIGAWQLHSGPVFALAFGADGHVYSAGADRCVLVTDPYTGRVASATMTASAPVALRVSADLLLVLDSTGGLYSFASRAAEPLASS